MTLSLDDVRNKRFRMARKSGYEVLEVDEFVDEVEASFAAMIEEAQTLRKQVDALKQTSGQDALKQTSGQDALKQTSGQDALKQTSGHAGGRGTAQTADSSAPTEERIVVTTGKEASTAVVRLVEMSTEQAERLVAEAAEDAQRIRDEANRSAHQVTTDARTRAERVESEARVNAERVNADAAVKAEKVDRDLKERRVQLFSELEQQRDQLTGTVNELRNFEAAYRSNLNNHLRSQIETLRTVRAEPAEVPNVPGLRPAGSKPSGEQPNNGGQEPRRENEDKADVRSETPRLDALLGEQR